MIGQGEKSLHMTLPLTLVIICAKHKKKSRAADATERTWKDVSYSSLTHLSLNKMAAILPDNIFNCIFLDENVWILLKISLKFVPKVRNNDIPALVQIVAWRRPSDKPLS